MQTLKMTAIPAEGANIFARFDDAELVAVQHSNGFVALYAEDDDMLLQVSNFVRSDSMSREEIASKLLNA